MVAAVACTDGEHSVVGTLHWGQGFNHLLSVAGLQCRRG